MTRAGAERHRAEEKLWDGIVDVLAPPRTEDPLQRELRTLLADALVSTVFPDWEGLVNRHKQVASQRQDYAGIHEVPRKVAAFLEHAETRLGQLRAALAANTGIVRKNSLMHIVT